MTVKQRMQAVFEDFDRAVDKYGEMFDRGLDEEAVEMLNEKTSESFGELRTIFETWAAETVFEANLNNPIAQLQERAQKNGLEFPNYVFSGPSGPSHVPRFECTCSAESVTRTGRGSNKQKAKRLAARAVLAAIVEQEAP